MAHRSDVVPPGRPTSDAFALPAGAPGDQAHRALAAIDRVHTDGGLPRIPIDLDVRVFGADAQYRYSESSGRALGIGVRAEVPAPDLVIVHEIGHFLDHQTLGRRGAFASARHPDLDPWREAVRGTRRYRALRGNRRVGELDGQPVGDYRYLLDYTELWARSYAQYVALKSQAGPLLEQVAATGTDRFPSNLAYWDDDDFAPILEAIAALFDRKGWLS